jgi:hypothetical protein
MKSTQIQRCKTICIQIIQTHLLIKHLINGHLDNLILKLNHHNITKVSII